MIIAEAPHGSGALITAADARRIGRPVFAVPGPLGARASEGTNALIAAGAARACLGAADVAKTIGLVGSVPPPAGDPLLDALAAGPLDPDALARRLRLDPRTLRARLVTLVLKGTVVDRGDGRFARGARDREPS